MKNRINTLMPGGIPKYIRCYDNDQTFDRYTVVYTGNYPGRDGCEYVGMSSDPYSPSGFGQHGHSQEIIDKPKYAHLGKKISFNDLPENCQKLVLRDYKINWNLPVEMELHE